MRFIASPARMIEQPSSSCMASHPRLAALIDHLRPQFVRVRFWMAGYGSPSPKPCQLFGTAWEAGPHESQENAMKRCGEQQATMHLQVRLAVEAMDLPDGEPLGENSLGTLHGLQCHDQDHRQAGPTAGVRSLAVCLKCFHRALFTLPQKCSTMI